jgi:hypothetical protein
VGVDSSVEDNQEHLLARLRSMAAQRGGRVRVADLIGGQERSFYQELLRHFGSLQSAHRRAGLPFAGYARKWSTARILDDLRRLRTCGIRLTGPALRHAGREDLLAAVEKHLGGLPRARVLAAIPDPPFERREPEAWTASRVVRVVLERHRNQEPLASSRVPPALRTAACTYWGGWRQAIEAAGLDYEAVRLVRKKYQSVELLEGLKWLSRTFPHMTWTELRRQPGSAQCEVAFGSLADALLCAGIADWPRRLRRKMMSREEAIDELQRLHRLGLETTVVAVSASNGHLARSIRRHFQSWRDALRAASITLVRGEK